MRKVVSLFVGSLLLASASTAAIARPSPEAKLARALEGRVAGESVNCINLRSIRSSRIVDDTAILFDAGRTIYVNFPTAGRESLNEWDAIVTNTHSSDLCSIDVVRLYDSSSQMQRGSVFLGEFVPYRRARAGRSD